jgi:hypothetical protein
MSTVHVIVIEGGKARDEEMAEATIVGGGGR